MSVREDLLRSLGLIAPMFDRLKHAVARAMGRRPWWYVVVGSRGKLEIDVAVRGVSVNCYWLGEPRYKIDFKRNGELITPGLTTKVADAAAAIKMWLDGNSVSTLREGFVFVDREARAYAELEDAVRLVAPTLAAQCEGEPLKLTFKKNDRSCVVWFWGAETAPIADFEWDGIQMFRWRADSYEMTGPLVGAWVDEQCLPSEVASRFPDVEIRDLAGYYESGDRVLGDFLQSWDDLETLWPREHRIRDFIDLLRSHGLDRTLRAGQSLETLIVSRSRRHGLTEENTCIRFDVYDNGVAMDDGLPEYPFDDDAALRPRPAPLPLNGALPDVVLAALRTLEQQPIEP